ncbi:MAG: GNAT family N-acetyltransferase [bacterium]|nr:GNAT family N-acetyltransferase [bacterium]
MGKIVPVHFENLDDFTRWQQFIYSRDDTHYGDLAQWRILFQELYHFKNYSYAYVDHDRFLGVISLYVIRSPFVGTILVSSPFFSYGGVYADDENVRDVLLRKIEDVGRTLHVDCIELRLTTPLPAPYKTNRNFLEHNLMLSDTPEDVWKSQISSNVRQNIRKSRKHQLEFFPSGDPQRCYQLLSHTIRDLGTPFHAQKFFQLLKTHFGDDVYFSGVHLNDELVAGGIVLKFKESISTPYIGSLKHYRQRGSNYCLYWNLINQCFSLNVKQFQFGRSPKGSTHSRFKKKWGAEVVQVFYNYRVLNPAKTCQNLTDPSKLFVLATHIWKRLPLFFTRSIGHLLFRYIP